MSLTPHVVEGWRPRLSSQVVLLALVQELVKPCPIVAELLAKLSFTVLDCWRITGDFRHSSGLMKASFNVNVCGCILSNVRQLDSLELCGRLACPLTLLLRFSAFLMLFQECFAHFNVG